MMENTRIGLNAGKVWRILNEKGDMLFVKIDDVEFSFG